MKEDCIQEMKKSYDVLGNMTNLFAFIFVILFFPLSCIML